MRTPTSKEIAAFLVDATQGMLERIEDDCTYHLWLAEKVSLVVAWTPGYDSNEKSKFIDKNGYGVEWSCRLSDSSYFVCDWDYLDEGAGSLICESDEVDEFVSLAENILKWSQQYINPQVIITIPECYDTNVLGDAYWVQYDDELKGAKRDLTELWWYYHGWSWGGKDKKELEDEIRLWADHLADYYGISEHVQEAITFPDLSDLIYNALIKRV